MAGVEIGEVFVKVRPDTKRFAEELRAQLRKVKDDFDVEVGLDTAKAKAEFKALKRQLQADDINANVKLNTRSLSQAASFRAPLSGVASLFFQMQNALNRMAAQSRRLTRSLVSIRQIVGSTVSQTIAWAFYLADVATRVSTLAKAVRGVGNAFRWVKSTTVGLADLAKTLAIVGEVYARLGAIRIGNVVRSIGSLSTYTNAARKAMDVLHGATDRVAVGLYRIRNIRISDVGRAIQRVGSAAKTAARSVVNFGAKGARGIGNLIDSGIKGLGGLFSKALSGVAGMAGKAGEALGSLSRGGAIAVAVLALLPPLLGLVAGLLAGLPSLIAAAGAGFAAIALGMDGIKNAAKTLTPQIDALKAALSQRWESGLTPLFNQMKPLFTNVIQPGLLAVTDGLLAMARGFTNVVTSAAGMQQIGTILQNTGKFFSGITPMVESLTSGFLTLAAVGSQSFGVLSGVLNRFGASFNEMVNRLANSGQLTAAIEAMAPVLDALLQGFVRLMDIGVQIMGTMGGPLSGAITGLVNLFGQLMLALAPVSQILLQVIGILGNALAPIATALVGPLTTLANMLGPVLTAAAQALTPIIAKLAEFLGNVLMVAIGALMPLVQPLVDLFTQLGGVLSTVVLSVITALTPLLPILADAFAQIVQAVIPLIPAIGEIAIAFSQVVLALTPLIPPLIQLVQAVLPIVIEVIKAVVPIILSLAQAFTAVIPYVVGLVSILASILIPIIEAVGQIVADVFPAIQMIIQGAMNIIQGIIKTVTSIIKGDWEGAWNGVKQILQGAVEAIGGILGGLISLVVGILTQLVGRITGIFSGAGQWLVDSGRAIIRGLIDGIKSMVQTAVNAVSGVVDKIRGFFPFSPAKEGAFSGKGYTTYSGRALIKDWAKGMEDEVPGAVKVVEDMMKTASMAADANWKGEIEGGDFGITGSVFDGVMAAFNGSRLQVDGNGMAKLVNNINNRNARR